MNVTIQPVVPDQAGDWLRMRAVLWPETGARTHRREIAAFLAGCTDDPHAVLVASDERGRAVGFVELTIRSHAEGCEPGRIAYLEGWYVDATSRRRGVGRALIAAAERWAREQGCTDFASDAWSTNQASRRAHRALGFKEVGVIRCFRKPLRRRHMGM